MKVMSNFFKNDLITISSHYYTLITSNSYIYIYICMYVCMYVCYEKIIKKLVIFTGACKAIINKPF